MQSAAAFPPSGLLYRDYWQAVKVLSPSALNRGHPVFWSRCTGGRWGSLLELVSVETCVDSGLDRAGRS